LFIRFKRLSGPQRHAFLACFLGWSLDAFDFFIFTYCVTAIAQDFHATRAAVLECVFWTLATRPIGAFLFGLAADRWGRRPALMVNILAYSALELASAFAGSLHGLILLRAAFGIAMGGEWGVGAALALESLPSRDRGFFSGLLQEGYVVGNLIAGALFATVFTYTGWRGMFIIGAVPALLVFYVRSKVPESPAWVKGSASATRNLRKTLSSVLRHSPLFLFLVLLMTGFNAFSHGTQDVYPTFLEHDHGFNNRVIGTIAVIYNIGALLGGIVFGTISERIGRKRAILTAALLAIPVIPLFAFAKSRVTLAIGAFLMQFMVQGAWGVVPAYLNELSPTQVRGTFPGLAYQLGNLIMSRLSVVQANAARHFGSYGIVLAITVLTVAIALSIISSLGREARGVALSSEN
jgi:SHS family lactate transporter-like MFS transporter